MKVKYLVKLEFHGKQFKSGQKNCPPGDRVNSILAVHTASPLVIYSISFMCYGGTGREEGSVGED